jgi:hypothetical protein
MSRIARALVGTREPLRLLGRHVVRRADRRPHAREPPSPAGGLVAHDLGDAEVDELDHRRLIFALHEEDVRRLEIAVHDAGDVGLVEGARRPQNDAARRLRVETPGAREQRAEVLARSSSMAMNRPSSGSVPASKTWTMWSLSMALALRASRLKRAAISACRAWIARTSLTATRLPISTCSAS